MRRAVAYCRVSSAEQAQRGLGLPVQRQATVDFARREGIEVVATFEDPGVSGTLALHERPGLAAALAAVKERQNDPLPVKALVVARWERLARDTLVSLLVEREFTRLGCSVLSADGIGVDQTTRELFMVLAGAERRNLVARLKSGRDAKRKRGGYAGGRPPFGFMAVDGELVPHPEEAAVVQGIFLKVARDGWSTRRLAAKLNAERRLGRGWDHTRVHSILKNEAYKRGAGRVVDPRVFNRAQERLAERSPHGRERLAA